MADDPMDVHIDRAAFWAAYTAAEHNGVTAAQIKAVVANLATVVVVRQHTAYGQGRMAVLVNDPDELRAVATAMAVEHKDSLAFVPRRAVNAAVAAAARVLGNVQ